MSLEERVVERLLRRSGRVPESDPGFEWHPARNACMVRVVQASLRRQVRLRRVRRRAVLATSGVAVAALLVLVVHFALKLPGGEAAGPSLVATNGDVRLLSKVSGGNRLGRGGMQLSPEVELLTGNSASAELELASGARVSVSEASALGFPSNEQAPLSERIALRSGRVDVRVPKLSPGRALSVVTPDSTVTVHGTRFSVSVANRENAPLTRVQVDNGRVEVIAKGQHLFLEAGQEWSSRAEHHKPKDAEQRASAPEVAPLEAKSATSTRNVEKKRPVPEAESSLALQNQMFERALGKVRARSFNGALEDLERLQRDHPRSPLMQSARVEHFRVLRQAGRTADAAREARRYLSDYPNGFARDDARRTALLGVGGGP